ncbi:MAG TPA: SpoIIE family protein phosphatase [Thermoleophilaceae bacterium]|jgi:serine phosphatase RsbU (regulator of sigma subunit)/putative methionine-R-sulfoxide reductase with GAF domain/anti-sigma regulatory factor (Ser/Thr protein kinase)
MAHSRPAAPVPEADALHAADARLRHLGAITEAALAHLDLDRLLDELLTRLRGILSVDTIAILLLDPDSNELVARAAKGLEEEVEQGVRIPVGAGFAGRVAADRRPIYLPKVDRHSVINPILINKGIASMLGVPLLVEGEATGVLHVGSLTPREFGADDAELLQLAADRMALAIDHARLYASEREARAAAEQRANQLTQLQAITDVALGRLSVDEDVLGDMLERVRDVLAVDTVAVLLLSAEGDELVARAARGLEEEVERGVRIPLGRGFAGRIAEQGEPLVLEDIDRADLVNPLLREKGIKTLVGVPLLVEERVIGVLHVGSLHPRVFAEEEIGLLERAADRIALAADRARQHTLAGLLQRTLLPARLPEVPSLRMAARYVPGSDEAHVGGDWYDVVELPHGRVGVAIGDVVSRGVRAAAVMGQMRTALRAYALDADGDRPGPVLDRLDRLVRSLDEREMATVAYVVIDPAESVLTASLAGHPPPLVLGADGSTRFLDGVRSRPIGVVAARRYDETTAPLERGETLILYTDGLVERRGVPIDEGMRRLEEVAASVAGADPDELCDRLVRLAEDDSVADDVAVLAIRLPAAAAESLAMTLPAEPGSLSTMRRAVRDWLGRREVDPAVGNDILVAMGEAAANAVEHAYGPGNAEFRLEARIDAGEIVVRIYDEGRWRPARGSHRGRGLSMMEALMEDVQVDSDESGTVVTMRRKLEGAGP